MFPLAWWQAAAPPPTWRAAVPRARTGAPAALAVQRAAVTGRRTFGTAPAVPPWDWSLSGRSCCGQVRGWRRGWMAFRTWTE